MKRIIPLTFCATLFAAIISLGLSGCVIVNPTDFNTVSGKGNPEKYVLRVGEYNGIRIEAYCEILYYSAANDTVILEVQPNLRDYFVVEVIDNELIVRTTRRISYGSGKTPVLTVSTPVLNRLDIEGAATFTAYDKISGDSFTLGLTGAGKSKAEVDVGNLHVYISGAGNLELSGLADIVKLDLSGAGELNALSLQSR